MRKYKLLQKYTSVINYKKKKYLILLFIKYQNTESSMKL